METPRPPRPPVFRVLTLLTPFSFVVVAFLLIRASPGRDEFQWLPDGFGHAFVALLVHLAACVVFSGVSIARGEARRLATLVLSIPAAIMLLGLLGWMLGSP